MKCLIFFLSQFLVCSTMMLMEKVAEMEAMIILAGTVVVKVISVPPFLIVCIAPTFFLCVACFYLLMKKV